MSRERIPVFPVEWLLLENIRNVEKLDLSMEEIKTVRDRFTCMVNEELRQREKFEKKITKNLIDKNVSNVSEHLKK